MALVADFLNISCLIIKARLYSSKPIKTEVQTDGRIRKWKFVKEAGKYLRVILLEDGETVHNAFFDRNFKEGKEK